MKEYNIRREKLFESLPDHSVALVFAGVSKIASEDAHLPFLANRNFFYLTGIEQENSVLMLIKCPGERKEYLFVDEYDEVKERWTGRRLTFEQASEISQIENVYAYSNFDTMLSMALTRENNMYGQINTVFIDLSDELKIAQNKSTQLFKEELSSKYIHLEFKNLYPLVVELRLVKSQAEINELVEAINNTSIGINDLLNNLHMGISEHELADRFEYYGKTHGRLDLAFETIIGSGENTIILHHPIAQQDRIIEFDDIVQFDLGYRYHGYNADISRAYPVSGQFTDKQRAIYEAVLECNKAVIDYIKPGLTIMDLNEYARNVLRGECLKRKLIKSEEDIVTYFIHNVSHFLGLDTHDVGDRQRKLAPGNVITVEPGLYFPDLKIGIRIEDDVLVTESGSICLSKGIKKEADDIERLLKNRR